MFHIFYNSFSIYAIFYVPPQKSLPTSLPVWGTPKLSCVRICLFVCGCLRVFELQSDKERNERSPKNVSVKPAVNFWLLAWPSSSLFTWPPPVGPTFCTTHPSPPPPLHIAADYFAIAAISFHLSGAESLSKRHILRPLEKSNRMGTQQKTITT